MIYRELSKLASMATSDLSSESNRPRGEAKSGLHFWGSFMYGAIGFRSLGFRVWEFRVWEFRV